MIEIKHDTGIGDNQAKEICEKMGWTIEKTDNDYYPDPAFIIRKNGEWIGSGNSIREAVEKACREEGFFDVVTSSKCPKSIVGYFLK